jgi:hypothetical protein
MDELAVTYYGYPFDASGYSQACRATIGALHSAGIQLSVVDLTGRPHQVPDPLVSSLLGRPLSPDFHLFHGIPPEWAARAFPLRNVIGMTVWETDAMPPQWRNILNHSLEVWLPSKFNQQVFGRALEKPVFVLPHPLPPPRSGATEQSCPLNGTAEGKFVFYSMFEWQERKNPHGILEAYLRAFNANDSSLLLLKTNPNAAAVAANALREAREKTKSDAAVEIRAEAWAPDQMEGLHARGDCYISLHRGEGWNYPLFEAAARGVPVVATAYSGPLDYLDPAAHRLVRCGVGPVLQRYRYYHPSMHWAEPDVVHAAAQLRWVFENREVARNLATAAAPRLRQTYSPESVGAAATDRLLSVLQRTRPERWRAAARSRDRVPLRPSIPIPPQWFDHDYFETGRKSNWDQGYSWQLFNALFRDTAVFLTDSFPEARSYFDAGCAKGYLIRALREKGMDAWGIDGSPYAIAQADQTARPFLEEARVEDFLPARNFDVALAFSILESLTENQVHAFLTRMRKVTEQALFAVIASLEDAERGEHVGGDRDLSHITIRPRAWWHEQFAASGWRQDVMTRVVQKWCQQHSLVSRMGWQVYLYVP